MTLPTPCAHVYRNADYPADAARLKNIREMASPPFVVAVTGTEQDGATLITVTQCEICGHLRRQERRIP
ncbi:MAG: hypothetical protein WCD38_11715 [Candidatus Tumulicola sp.]